MVIKGVLNGGIFLACLPQVLAPVLTPRGVMTGDNFHRRRHVAV